MVRYKAAASEVSNIHSSVILISLVKNQVLNFGTQCANIERLNKIPLQNETRKGKSI